MSVEGKQDFVNDQIEKYKERLKRAILSDGRPMIRGRYLSSLLDLIDETN